MTRFKRTAGTPYTVVTPSTELAELESFLDHNIFAISASPTFSCVYEQKLTSLPVTDYNRKFVLAVATKQDLEASPICLRAFLSVSVLILPSGRRTSSPAEGKCSDSRGG